ncbi:M phase inducer phosphatase [Tubulinosema ratisbonensis]|uniref:M-phase inducer phosphatase n=1 Tax=Tubulinosema ratisbonensis TaxID=291195 RepID=A0A437AI66_9MICR|nr:M phase inducer phosphatase [Tubulinosema ratisbonensis]
MSSEPDSIQFQEINRDEYERNSESSLLIIEENESLFLKNGKEIFEKKENENNSFEINKEIKIVKTPFRNKKTNFKNSFIKNIGISFKHKLSEKVGICDKKSWYDFDNGEKHALPTLGMGKCDSIRRIDAKILKRLLTKEYFMNFLVVDCRYPYEYQGGHIEGAINISTPEEMKIFYEKFDTTGLILHCEFSSVRAPYLSRVLRLIDRSECEYPKLKFPEIYILEGGYKSFYEKFPEHCIPRGYVKMNSNSNENNK